MTSNLPTPDAAFARPFNLLRHGRVYHGTVFPSGRAVVVDDPEAGLATAAVSLEHLMEGYGAGNQLTWPAPAITDEDLHTKLTAALTAEHQRRAAARIEASPEEHSAAMADIVIRVLQEQPATPAPARSQSDRTRALLRRVAQRLHDDGPEEFHGTKGCTASCTYRQQGDDQP